jgi:hypothetical protein
MPVSNPMIQGARFLGLYIYIEVMLSKLNIFALSLYVFEKKNKKCFCTYVCTYVGTLGINKFNHA